MCMAAAAAAAARTVAPFDNCCRHHPPHADVLSSMARPHATAPHGGGASRSSSATAPSSFAAPPAAFGEGVITGDVLPHQLRQQQHLSIFDYLSDDQVRPPAAVPGAFVAPSAMAPAEPPAVVPDAAAVCYPHPRSMATAMAGEGRASITTDRIAFRTRSDDEILDDGYKWRKYGKKSVKNSPNPRNYYRCSTEGCNVKKRVERDKNDPSYVVTTYEGIHNHVSPGTVYYAAQDAASGRFFVAGMHHPELY
ncbi:hypothetical protein GUJ93_ZPchr0001g31668 [Zizania palustris]|uniref:WRKY domain-containing protein n=1 Tax=Zizania palustris TaxID=103762 RepID=A0A8J5S5H9_ZIZPA|nr:hypothetical protein GUJ93_ZPchr0001g31668 [Zizania palustris]